MRGEKYIVDNVVMVIAQVKRRHAAHSPYWVGRYKAANGQWQQRYFGQEDPRPRYQRFHEPMGLLWLYGLGRWQRT